VGARPSTRRSGPVRRCEPIAGEPDAGRLHDGCVIDDLVFALHLADLADEISRDRFDSKRYAVSAKADGSAVTDADRRIEEVLAGKVAAVHPEDGFLSEELGETLTPSGSRRRWIVDGIDGTAAFVAGGLTWGTLVALVEEAEVKVGVASSPGLRRRWWASRGAGAWTGIIADSSARSEPSRLSVATSEWEPRGVVVPQAGLLKGWRDDAVRLALGGLRSSDKSGHGPLLVAKGDIEASVHLWGGPWDHAPFVVIVEEAGGTFSDVWGGRRIDTATAIFSNGVVHEAVRRRLLAAAPAHPDAP
jgi:histidinol-phosphatase